VSGFRFVEEHQAEHRITDMCRIGGVSRSSFCARTKRTTSARARSYAVLLEQIREIHNQSRRTYGAPRIAGQLRRRGIRVSPHRVARLMRNNGLVGAHARRDGAGATTGWSPIRTSSKRDFTAPAPDLAATRDLHDDRSIVGWSMGERQTTDLVVAALVIALGRRNPSAELVHHADHGCHTAGRHRVLRAAVAHAPLVTVRPGLLLRVAVEPGDRAQPASDGRAGPAVALEVR
jgi:putative transposase